MNIIYHCVGGTHSSAIASAIHLKFLPENKIPSKEEIMSIGYFDTLDKPDQGKIIYRGSDEFGNKVYTLSRQLNKNLVLNTLKDSYSLAGGNLGDIILVDTMQCVNILMKIGGFSSRKLKLVFFGRPIVIKGSQLAYMNIVNLVRDIKSKFTLN
ncbi:Protein of unknown function [Alkalithermobacter thermoalcaliphilus JW-YL-7 = DSM 7308]|uniref:DUF3189 family protein n=1 Tax=Alkalithermobacter thermoalcaliphilus JW-YL-7 = DSM 7308 TaxID=1121328 RepID=A0A150FP60_CLOPD|nr:Protein of unknown function DUF3189 [[Clostridium] paradoxum JW-YL-7 = DSM 7308]SHK53059.1 Protein of unknown function [[Clostridium] paradoxum JW-YL-7 = DSM 7308]